MATGAITLVDVSNRDQADGKKTISETAKRKMKKSCEYKLELLAEQTFAMTTPKENIMDKGCESFIVIAAGLHQKHNILKS